MSYHTDLTDLSLLSFALPPLLRRSTSNLLSSLTSEWLKCFIRTLFFVPLMYPSCNPYLPLIYPSCTPHVHLIVFDSQQITTRMTLFWCAGTSHGTTLAIAVVSFVCKYRRKVSPRYLFRNPDFVLTYPKTYAVKKVCMAIASLSTSE